MAGMLALTLVAGGCGGDSQASESPGSAPAPQSGAVTVTALDNVFKSPEIVVTAGSTVTWRNAGRNDHNMLTVEGDAGWGVATADFGPGATYSHTFDTPGTYRYYCSIHGTADKGMVGTVEVVAS